MAEVIFTNTGDAAEDRRVRRLAQAGRLRRIVPRVYTDNSRDPLDAIVRRNLWSILGKLFPGSVISARTAALTAPAFGKDAAGNLVPPGFVFLTGPSRRSLSLPGVEVRIAAGPGPLPGDVPFSGLYLASAPRQLLENLSPTRERSGMARGLGRDEVERFLVRQCDVAGEDRLNEIRDVARDLRAPLGAEAAFRDLDGLIGALLRSRTALLSSPAGLAMARGEPIDGGCVDRLNALFTFLRSTPMSRRPDRGAGTPAVSATAFVEAYFSNYIEGTRFLVEEARAIVFDGVIPERRPRDGHDVLATFRQVSAVEDMLRPPDDFESFETALRARHHALMAARPEVSPGQFKALPNQAGNTVFVQPEHVRGTLREGFRLLSGLDEPLARAVFVHFLVADVHPFADGNGRISRILMATELVRGAVARIVIPTVSRDDYLGAMRALTRHGDPAPVFRFMDRAQGITAAIVEPDVPRAIEAWATTHAFVEPGEHAQFTAPNPDLAIEWRNGVPAPRSYWAAIEAPPRGPF
ncbi:MAG: Fic family protein [Alphaproteobacteria bacterium]|nr:Fic family protein [Alphaproteobacteria bacterium]